MIGTEGPPGQEMSAEHSSTTGQNSSYQDILEWQESKRERYCHNQRESEIGNKALSHH